MSFLAQAVARSCHPRITTFNIAPAPSVCSAVPPAVATSTELPASCAASAAAGPRCFGNASNDPHFVGRAGSVRLVFLGAPGVGKGTFADKVAPHFGIPAISTGSIIRSEIKSGSEFGAQLETINNGGHLVPDDLMTDIVRRRLSQDDTLPGFLLDGFPRTREQADMLQGFRKLNAVVNIRFPVHLLVDKIASRRVCDDCGRNYNLCAINQGDIRMDPLLPEKEGVCDDCGGKLSQRDDDKEAVVKNRLDQYEEKTQPLIEFYEAAGLITHFDVKTGVKDTPQLLDQLDSLVKNK